MKIPGVPSVFIECSRRSSVDPRQKRLLEITCDARGGTRIPFELHYLPCASVRNAEGIRRVEGFSDERAATDPAQRRAGWMC